MTVGSRSLLAVAISLLSASFADAACTSAACPDVVSIESVRSLVAAACDCAGVSSHGTYVRCARDIVKAAVRDARLTKACKQAAMRCEAQSGCGRRKTDICCAVKRGRVKAKLIRTAARCAGTTCGGQMSVADACTAQGTCAATRRGIKSFRSVQQVFKTSCALSSCHSTLGHKGNLVLESEDVSYASLVGRPAAQHDAQQLGLVRVRPGDPQASYLIRKLRGQGPGDPMPQAGGLLPEPVIQMIEKWIARGGHSTAEECRLATGGGSAQQYCDDEPVQSGDYHWQPEPPLDPPPAGTGIQLYTPRKPVPAGQEWETCFVFRPDWLKLGADLGMPPGGVPVIREQVYRMHKGSHHLLLYAYIGGHPEQWASGYFPCQAANCVNPGDCPSDLVPDPAQPDRPRGRLIPIGGTQVAGTRYDVKYPSGVGIPVLAPNMVLIANLHYTDPFQPAQDIYGESWLNLYFYRPGEFKALLDGVFAINYAGLLVEPYQTRTISRIWQPHGILGSGNTDAAIFQLFGHMHKRGTEFRIDYVKGGACSGNHRPCGRDADCRAAEACVRTADAEDTTIYYTTAWDQAPVMDFAPPYFLVNHDEGLRWTCTHTNGVAGDPAHPPKRCAEGCEACGWDAASGTCIFTRGVEIGMETTPRIFHPGDPMPLVFGLLADDDMCNMFGYFINQSDLARLP